MACFKVRRLLRATGGIDADTGASLADIEVGGDTNYSSFDTSGRQTMAGTARVYKDRWLGVRDFAVSGCDFAFDAHLQAGSMTAGSILLDASGSIFTSGTAAAMPLHVLFPTGNVTGSIVYSTAQFPKPTDADTTGSIGVRMVWTSHDTMATAGSVFCFKAGMVWLGAGSVARTAASIAACPAYDYTASGTIVETDVGDFNSFTADDNAGVLLIGQDQQEAADTAGSGWALIGVKLRYVANSLGTQVS